MVDERGWVGEVLDGYDGYASRNVCVCACACVFVCLFVCVCVFASNVQAACACVCVCAHAYVHIYYTLTSRKHICKQTHTFTCVNQLLHVCYFSFCLVDFFQFFF